MDKIFRISALALGLSPLAAVAQDRTWVAPSGSWDTPANWSGNAVPTAANNAFIGSGAATVGAGVSGTANTLILSGTGIDPLLTISGGYLSTANALLGPSAGRGGFATINSGTWNNSGVLTLGDGTGGLGSITLNGGLLFSGSGSVVNYGTVSVFGGTWNNNGRDISFGGIVSGLTMTSGLVTNGNATVGTTPGGLSQVGMFSGTWNSSGVLTVGQSGSGKLTVFNGNVSSGTLRVAELAGSSGEVSLMVDDFLGNTPGVIATGQIVEGAGSGTITLGSGTLRATGNQADFISGFETGDVVLVGTNLDASVFDTNGFQVGINTTMSGTGWLRKVGAGTLTISGSQAYSGVTTVDSGTLEVATGGVIDQSVAILVGATTPASLLVSGGYVGSQVGIGGGTSLMTGGTMNTIGVGVTGGSFTQSGGLITISQQLNISTSGTVFVNGGTLNAANSPFFNIGVATGTGTLNISGGQVTSGLSYLGYLGASGRVTMTGGTWNAADLFVGAGGNSSLNLSGGNLFSGTSIVGAASDSTATVTGGTWTGSNGLFVGYSGTGTLTVGGSGLVNTGTLVLGDYTTDSVGTLNLGTGAAGGVLQTSLVTTGTGSGAINFDGGTLRATANQANFLAGFDSNDVSLLAGGAFVDSNGFSIGIGTVLSGTGGLTKLGSGTLTLTGSNSYTGGTTVNAGTLFQGTSGAFVNNTAYAVNGGTLDLNNISLTASSFSGTGGFVNLGSGTLTVNQSGATSYAGSIYGSAGLVKQGAGSLTLTGSNSYSGGTVVRSGTLAISSGGSINHASGAVTVGSASGDVGMLSINGGSLTSGQAFLGNGSGAQGTVSVTAGTWSNTGNINVGASGAGTLNLNTGGLVTAQQVWLAASSTNSQGTVMVNGGTLSPTNGLIVGYRGTGALNISNGVVSSGVNLAVGNNAGSDGTINLTGGLLQHSSNAFIGTDGNSKGSIYVNGGTWNNTGAINVGHSGIGQFTIDTGTVSSGVARIGNNAGSSGTATVNGGVWTMTAASVVGNSGTGHLFLNGGLVSGTSLTIASATTSTGFVTVTGGTLASTGNLIVGSSGTGSLLLEGGLVSSSSTSIANSVTGNGSALVTGGTWANAGLFSVGSVGTGTLQVDGGLVSQGSMRIANSSTGTGYLLVTGGTVASTGGLLVGTSGYGSLSISGGVVSGSSVTIGLSSTGTGTVLVTGGTMNFGAFLGIGQVSTGALEIDGGVVTGSTTFIGTQLPSGQGKVLVTSGTWNNSGNLLVGDVGTGTMQINGGAVISARASIGSGTTSRGTVEVTNGVWTNSTTFTVGGAGDGTLQISGGLVSGSMSTIGLSQTGTGVVTVTGGTWANSGVMHLANAGTGTLAISGGMVTASQITFGLSAAGAGRLNLSGGLLQTGLLNEGMGSGIVLLNGGTLRATGNQADYFSNFEAGDVTVDSGGAFIDSNGFSIGIGTALSGVGGFTKMGAGTLSLSGSNSYAGSTTISSGTLAVNGVNSGTGAVTVQNGATLAGTGTISGAVTLQNGSTLATGNSIGTLSVGAATFESGSLFSLEGNGAFFDSLVVSGNVTLQSGALITFDLLGSLTASSYTLISATGGLDGSVQFTLSGSVPAGYQLEYAGTALNLVQVQATIGPITATPNDTTIITGGTTSVVVTVANSGTTPGGADLDATVTGDGTTVSGTGTAVVAQGATGTAAPDLTFSGTTIGVQTGTVTVTDPEATNSPQAGTVTVNVLDHADPILTVSGGNSQSVIVGATGITATLNLANGSTGEANLSPMDVGNLSTGLSGTTGSGAIGSGASAEYTASLNTGTVGAGQNQVFSLDAGDQQSLPGASPLSTYSATVALNVYGHAEPVVSGSTFNLGYLHEGYTSPVVSNTITVTNGSTGDYIVDLRADGVTSGDLSLNGISGVGAGDSAGVAVTLGTGLGVGTFGGVLVQTYADDSSLAGASSNVGTVAYSVTGEVYSGHGVWNTAGGGSWGTFDSGFGVNWQAGGGSPGLDAAFASTDTATFGTAGSGVVTLDGAAPSLKAITFDNATDSYALLQGSGGTITLNGGTNTAVIENLNGNHFIQAPLQLATNTLFTVANVADSLTISGTIFGSGNVEVGGSGRTILTQNQSYAGTTTVTSGVLASRNLTGGAVNVNGGLFSPGNEGTISTVTVSTLNLNGGGLEFDLSTPAASDGIIVTGTTTLNTATQFTFLDSGFEAGLFTLVQSGTLANFGNLSGLTFVSDIDGLQGLFGVANNTLYFRGFTADTIFTGPVLSNYAPYLIPTTGKFLVDGPVTTWPEDLSNTIDSLIFKNGSSLFVYNDLTVTSGDFTVRRGSATIEGGRVVVPGDFNLIGKGTLIAGSEFAIGGDANVNGGNLVIDGLFNAGGNMNVHSTVTVNGNAQIAGNLNTDDSEIIVNGIFGIGKSANISNSSSLLVNSSGAMNVAQATNIGAGSNAQINGLLTSPQVNVSGLLKGTGVIAGNVWNNGIVAPGNSPGLLTVNGNYVQTSNGTLQIELGDLLLVSGNASLAGQLQLIAAGKLKYGQQITFLQAGSISGEFDEILVPNPSKNRGRVLTEGGTGTLLIAPTSYTLVAETSNQRKVARALDGYIPAQDNDRETVSIALDLQTAEQYPAAFDQIAPTYYESLGNITIEQAFVQSQQLNQRLSAVRLGARGFQAIGIESPLRHDKDGKSVFEAKDAKKTVEIETATNWNIWAMGNGTFARVTGIGQLPNYNFNSGGFLVGGDYRWSENFATGLFGGYQYTWADAGDSGNTQINSALFGGYATYQSGGFYADGIVGGGYNGYRVRRGINFSTVDRTARSQPNGGQFNASLNLGYDWEIGKFTLGPIAGVQYAYAGIAPFSETGADSLDLRVAQQNVNSMRTTFGGRVAYTWNVTDKIALIPEVRMFWQHEFLNNPRNISSALDGGSGSTFGYETSAPARDSVFAGAGISAQFGERWNAFFYWNVDFGRQDYFGNSISGGLNWKF